MSVSALADALSPGLQFLPLFHPKSSLLVAAQPFPIILRQTWSNKQLWQTTSGVARARTGPASPSPLHHITPPFLRIGAEEAGQALSKPLCSQKDETGNAFRPRPFQQLFRSLVAALISRAYLPRRPIYADCGRAAWQWRIESSRELTREALPGPCCFHRLTPFDLTFLNETTPRRCYA